jgi:SAM-dependent methyltransferase
MTEPDAIIDVEALVGELRERVARQRAEGAYADDLAGVALDLPAPGPAVRFRPELAYSSKPGVGKPITAVKQTILRLLIHVFDDLARQTSVAIDETRAEARAAQRRADEALAAETAAREAAQRDLQGLMARIEAVEGQLERLQPAARLARLERAARRPAAAPAEGAPAAPAAPLATGAETAARPPVDYLAFEARFRGSEETIRARQGVYRELLAGRRRVADLGCGRGELLDLLAEDGVEAYGVELNPDFVELVREKGREVVEADALAHLEGLAPGEVDGIVASHVVEHMPPHVVSRLVEAAAERLPEGGVLVLETPNPESLVAGSVNFHRDPTHLRPVHPDTLAFICESAGFREVEIRRLSPFPDAERLPLSGDGEGPLAAHLDRVVGRLNDLIYGFQDYAVVARR